MEDELYHYGVKGMKWGIRKQVDRAHKAWKSSQFIQEQRRDERERALNRARLYAQKSEMSRSDQGRFRNAGRAIRYQRKVEAMDKTTAGDFKGAMKLRLQNVWSRSVMPSAVEGRIAEYRENGYQSSYAALKAYGMQAAYIRTTGIDIGVGAGAIATGVLIAKIAMNRRKRQNGSK